MNESSKKSMGSDHPLSKAATIGDVTSWQLHWLTCQMNQLREQLDRDFCEITKEGSGRASEAVDEYKLLLSDYQRLVWEVKTILGLDAEADVYPMLHSLTNHAVYLSAVAAMKTTLARIAEQAGANLRDSLLAKI